MIIETLILCTISGIIGILIGKVTNSSLYTKYNGWTINAWKGVVTDKYYIVAQHNKTKRCTWFTIGPNGSVCFNSYRDITNGE